MEKTSTIFLKKKTQSFIIFAAYTLNKPKNAFFNEITKARSFMSSFFKSHSFTSFVVIIINLLNIELRVNFKYFQKREKMQKLIKNGIIWLRFPILQTHKNVLVYVRSNLSGHQKNCIKNSAA